MSYFPSRLAIVTGHSRGLGKALASKLIEADYAVWGISRRLSDDDNVFAQTELDLADSQVVERLIQSDEWFQRISHAKEIVLINNAGVVSPNAILGSQPADEIIRAVAVNVASPLLLSNAILKDKSDKAQVRILHISSGAGRHAYAGWSVYGATKAALDHHARCVNGESHPLCWIASIAPGVVNTDMQGCIREAQSDVFPLLSKFENLYQNQALAAPEKVAEQIIEWLLSEDFGTHTIVDVRNFD